MPPKHLCPNCGGCRDAPDAQCDKCHFPNHARRTIDRNVAAQWKHPPFQFHIRTLFAVTTLAAIVCAITKSWGLDGLWLAVQIVFTLLPVIEFLYYFWINVRSDEHDAVKEYEDRFFW